MAEPVAPKILPSPVLHLGAGTLVKLEPISGVTSRKHMPGPFTFQVSPTDTLPIPRSWPWQDYDTIGAGQRSRPGSRQLRTVAFDSLFIADTPWWSFLTPDLVGGAPTPGVRGAETDAEFALRVRSEALNAKYGLGNRKVPDPLKMIAALEKLGNNYQVFTLTIRQPNELAGYDVNMWATLRNFDTRKVAGEPFTRYFSITFVEYRPTKIEREQIGHPHLPLTVVAGKLPPGRDTLHELAKFYYGSPSQWRRIAAASHLKVGPSYDLNKLGTKRIVVPKPASKPKPKSPGGPH
jgi:hypothetical protein